MAEKPNSRLDSWKEIADYLGRDVRTLLRWEKEKGLPVHRIPGGKRHAVFAYPKEIDAWLAGQHPNHLERPSNWYARFLVHPTRFVWVVVFVIVVVVSFFLVRGFRPGDAQVVRISGQQISVVDGQGKLLWVYRYPQPLVEYDPGRLTRWVRLADLDGDGSKELLFVATTYEGGNPNDVRYSLDCFSAKGKLLWRFMPDQTLSFAGRRFEAPWYMTVLDVTSAPRTPDIWLVGAHNVWWPSFLTKLDTQGRATLAFVNSGHISVLVEFKTSSGRFFLAGGVNNEYNAGMLAVLDLGKLPATSPQTVGSAHHCDGCPSGTPWRYFVFPRSELNLAEAAPYNAVWGIQIFDHQFEITTIEVGQAGLPVGSSTYQGRYRFSDKFELVEAFRSDAYWDLHRRLEREGKIKHSVERCPEHTKSIPIRMWTPETGWSEVFPQVGAKK